jgi:hypothetical protein
MKTVTFQALFDGRKLLLPGGGTSELQIRDVRARQPHHESNRPQQSQP